MTTKKKIEKKDTFNSSTWPVCVIVIIIGLALSWLFMYPENDKQIDIINMKNKYPTQNDSLWISLKSGTLDIIHLRKPSNFILLYTPDGESTVERILEEYSRYFYNLLPNCYREPLQLTHETLSSEEILQDYGIINHRYKSSLENRCLMIVKNINKVPGKAAQAFHSICDEHDPWVEKSAIIFTIKVPHFSKNNNDENYVRNILQSSWHEIDNDIFEPLFTRISSMILRIYPEKTLYNQNEDSSYKSFVQMALIFLVLPIVCLYYFLVEKEVDPSLQNLINDYPQVEKIYWQKLFPISYNDIILITYSVKNDVVDNIINSILKEYERKIDNCFIKLVNEEELPNLLTNVTPEKNYLFLIEDVEEELANEIKVYLAKHTDILKKLNYAVIYSVEKCDLAKIRGMMPENNKVINIKELTNHDVK